MKTIGILLAVCALAALAPAQKTEQPAKEKPAAAAVETKKTDPMELAKKALAAHGGDKFKNYKTLIARGSVDLSASFGGSTQTFPGSFVMILAGDKYRYEVNSIRSFKQTYDGAQTISSEPSLTLPPVNRLGLPLLQKLDEKGYVVSALPDGAKKKNGFRITSPEGFYTDFFLDEKTNEVKSYEAAYDFNGRNVTTSVEIDKLREVDGVKIPEKYAQRFELGFGTFYADFKSKDLLLNTEVADDVFSTVK